MERWTDAAAVILFAGATAVVALHARGCFATEATQTSATVSDEPYTARVAAALPHLERHVAFGSMRTRDATCSAVEPLADIGELESAIGRGDDPAISVPLAQGISALRECVACTPEPHGCAAAARAFTVVEERLGQASAASGS